MADVRYTVCTVNIDGRSHGPHASGLGCGFCFTCEGWIKHVTPGKALSCQLKNISYLYVLNGGGQVGYDVNDRKKHHATLIRGRWKIGADFQEIKLEEDERYLFKREFTH